MAKEIKYVARHLIPMTLKPGKAGDKAKGIAPVAPTIQEIKPGDRIMFDPDAKETKFLLDAGAIVKANKDDEKAPVTFKVAKEKPSAAPKKDDKPPAEKAPKDMTVAELKAALDAKEVEYAADAKKADLVTLMEEGDDDEPLV